MLRGSSPTVREGVNVANERPPLRSGYCPVDGGAIGNDLMETLIKDIRFGIRSLIKRPGFTSIAVITLALGIGANTAIFSVVNATLLRPLPFKDPERIVMVWGYIPKLARNADKFPSSAGNYLGLVKQAQ